FELRLIFLVTLCDDSAPASSLLNALKRLTSEIPVILVVSADAPSRALELLEVGADDFVTMPLQTNEVLARAWRWLRQGWSVERVDEFESAENHSKKLIGNSPNFLQQVAKIPLIAASEANVLLMGETGTGKELHARAIHYGSRRAGKPFIPVNCGAIPVEL